MMIHSQTAEEVALHLLKIGAVKLRPEAPFTWASGLLSPIYCDNRLTLSYPALRTRIKKALTETVREYFPETGLIAGVATAGIPQGVLTAEELNLPFVYVRASAKNHGMTNRIEGRWQKGQTAVVVEDLVSTGKSSLAAVEALREAGMTVSGMVSVFTYELPVAEENFNRAGCKLVSLSGFHSLIKMAQEHHFIDKSMLTSLLKWREDPQKWSRLHSEKN
jgi:orotate phosphoribosyltransferase